MCRALRDGLHPCEALSRGRVAGLSRPSATNAAAKARTPRTPLTPRGPEHEIAAPARRRRPGFDPHAKCHQALAHSGHGYSLSAEGLAPVACPMMPALSADYRVQRKDHSVAAPEDDFQVGLAPDWGGDQDFVRQSPPRSNGGQPCSEHGPLA